jgi:hypothetical protein
MPVLHTRLRTARIAPERYALSGLLTTSGDSRWFDVEPSLLKAVDHVVDGIA